jgi:hypothetical protein
MKNIGYNTFSQDCPQTMNKETFSINDENASETLTEKAKLVKQWEDDK